jgi:uncharacterized protein YqiB (DUF1249 family)
MATSVKPRYKVDLARNMSEYEANYARLMKLLPQLHEEDAWTFDVDVGSSHWLVSIDVQERAKYTTTITVSQADNLGSWSQQLQLQVRLYHDARMAEVLSWQQHRRMQVRYEYPNRQMYHADEKAQFNGFLGEWLSHCLANGQARINLDRFTSNAISG